MSTSFYDETCIVCKILSFDTIKYTSNAKSSVCVINGNHFYYLGHADFRLVLQASCFTAQAESVQALRLRRTTTWIATTTISPRIHRHRHVLAVEQSNRDVQVDRLRLVYHSTQLTGKLILKYSYMC